jgi:hypothetical protein
MARHFSFLQHLRDPRHGHLQLAELLAQCRRVSDPNNCALREFRDYARPSPKKPPAKLHILPASDEKSEVDFAVS